MISQTLKVTTTMSENYSFVYVSKRIKKKWCLTYYMTAFHAQSFIIYNSKNTATTRGSLIDKTVNI